MILKLNDTGNDVKLLQERLGISSDGHFGNMTRQAVIDFQRDNGLVADGIAGDSTLSALGINFNDSPTNKFLTEDDYQYAASLINCEVAAVKAVVEVESMGSGFLSNGDVKILFEPHIFWRELKSRGIDPSKHTSGNSDILYQKWKSGAYGPTNIQWSKMNRAMKINKEAALASASYGKFQIMGFNFKICGYNNVNDYVNSMMVSERYHLLAFINFVKGNKLDRHLVNRNWASFALGYNGSGYKTNKYDIKLNEAYNKYR